MPDRVGCTCQSCRSTRLLLEAIEQACPQPPSDAIRAARRKAAKARWEGISSEDRVAHARMAAAARWGKP